MRWAAIGQGNTEGGGLSEGAAKGTRRANRYYWDHYRKGIVENGTSEKSGSLLFGGLKLVLGNGA